MEIKNLRNAEPQTGDVDAKQRLAASRSQLMRHMSGDPRGTSAGKLKLNGVSGDTRDTNTSRLNGGLGIWYLIKIGLSRWWRHHPANLAVAVATPLLHRYAERKPFQLIAIAAGTGAVLVIAKPWRLISVGSLALATIKSSEFSELITSLLTFGERKVNSTENS